MITAVRRIEDGYLVDIQTIRALPKDTAPRIQNAIAEAGGKASEWELVQIDPEIWEHYNPRCKHYLVVEDGQTRLYQSDPEPEPEAEAEPVDVLAEIREMKLKIAALESQVESRAE